MARVRYLILTNLCSEKFRDSTAWVEPSFKGAFTNYVDKPRLHWKCQRYEDISPNKGQLNSELINEVIVSPKMPTQNCKDFCCGRLLKGREEIFQIFGWHFERNDGLINFILNLTDL